MLFLRKKSNPLVEIEFSGLRFRNPLGVPVQVKTPFQALKVLHTRPGFVSLTPPKEGILPWIESLQKLPRESVLAVNIRHDIVRSFSLLYDFPDFIIVDPDGGSVTPDISDLTDLLDSLLSLRLCYERYTPLFVRVPQGLSPDEVAPLLSFCQLSGVDGMVVSGASKAVFAREHTLGRMPIIVSTQNYDEALSLLLQGYPVECALNSLLRVRLLKSLEKEKKKNG